MQADDFFTERINAEIPGWDMNGEPWTVITSFDEEFLDELRRKPAAGQRVIVLAEVNEILMLLEDPDASLGDWLRSKIMAATVDRKPPFYPALRPRSA